MTPEESVATFLFTDIEGSARLWEAEPLGMRAALARHDALARASVEDNGGLIVKMTGDGIHAAFDDALRAVIAAVRFQEALAELGTSGGVALRVRCGLHVGPNQRRDNDFFGAAVNRAARIMSVAHGGQVLLSQHVAALVEAGLPQDIALRDLGVVRLRDLADPERVFQIVHPRLRQDFPSLRSLEATPNNLAQQASSFIGRERELEEVIALMSSTRLLTLHGAGGIGKTRLSLQIAARLIDDYPDGVWFTELAGLTDERLIPQAVAGVLGVKEEGGLPLIEALAKHVKDRELLIIFDNCEHLIDACAGLAKRLLGSGAKLRILTTSRERLNVAGETTFSVPSLSLPSGDNAASIDSLAACEAGRLFIERATAVQPGFRASLDNAGAIIEICRRLDGIPLAIELAAARVRGLAVEQIAARLSDRFRLLTRGDRAALPRQQTLRALIDWSYDLLPDDERVLLQRLAVFAGGWTLDAAEVVAAGRGLERVDVFELLTQLVEKSLVVLDMDGSRYRLLDTVRQYAYDRLDESGEAALTRNAHFDFCLALAETARPELLGPNQGDWLRRLDLERENLLSAHSWCDHPSCDAERALSLALTLKDYWRSRGSMGLGHRMTVEALARTETHPPSRLRSQGCFIAGQFCCFMGRYEEAKVYLEESLAIARTFGDKGTVEAVLQLLGIVALGEADLSAARGYLEEALALAKQLGNKRELAAALNARAQLHRAEGQLDAAQSLYSKFMELAIESGDRERIATGLLNLSMVSIGRGQAEAAGGMLLDALAIAEQLGSRPAGQSVLEVTAGLAAARRVWPLAARLFGAAEAQTAMTGLHRDAVDDAFLVPLVQNARAALTESEFLRTESLGRALSYEQALLEARVFLESPA